MVDEHTALLPQPVGASPRLPHARPGTPASKPRCFRTRTRTLLCGILLLTGLCLFWRSALIPVDEDAPRSAPPPVPAGEGTVLSQAQWGAVQPRRGKLCKGFVRRTNLTLDPTTSLFVHSFGARHTASLLLQGGEGAGSGAPIQVSVEAYADVEWALKNHLNVVALNSSKGAAGVGIYSSRHPFRDPRHTIDVHLIAHLPPAQGNFTRINVRADAANFTASHLDAFSVRAVHVNLHVGRIAFEGDVPRTSLLQLHTDAGTIHVPAPVRSNTVLAQSQTGTVKFGAVHATSHAFFQSHSGTVDVGSIYAPGAEAKTQAGSIHIGQAEVGKRLFLQTQAGSIHVPGPVWSDTLVAESQHGGIKFDEVHATTSVRLQSDAGTVSLGSVHAPHVSLLSNLGHTEIDRGAVVQHLRLQSKQGPVTAVGLSPVLFPQGSLKVPDDFAAVSLTSVAGSVTAAFTDKYDDAEGDPPTTLAETVQSTMQSETGRVEASFAPSFAGLVDARSKMGKVDLSWATAHPTRDWAWNHEKRMLGETFEGCVFTVSSQEHNGEADEATVGTTSLPARCTVETVPARARASSSLGSVRLTF